MNTQSLQPTAGAAQAKPEIIKPGARGSRPVCCRRRGRGPRSWPAHRRLRAPRGTSRGCDRARVVSDLLGEKIFFDGNVSRVCKLQILALKIYFSIYSMISCYRQMNDKSGDEKNRSHSCYCPVKHHRRLETVRPLFEARSFRVATVSAIGLGCSAPAPGAAGLGCSAPAPGAAGLGCSAPAPGAVGLGYSALALGSDQLGNGVRVAC
jgi:hypothetical protein